MQLETFEIGEHTKAAIRSGGQLMLKQAMRGKFIFHAQITFASGEGFVGNIAMSEEGALNNLEALLKIKAA